MDKITLSPEDAAWLLTRRSDEAQVRVGFIRYIEGTDRDRYYEMYKRYINPRFVLLPTCSDCQYRMVSTIWKLAIAGGLVLEPMPAEPEQPANPPAPPAGKPVRPKKEA